MPVFNPSIIGWSFASGQVQNHSYKETGLWNQFGNTDLLFPVGLVVVVQFCTTLEVNFLVFKMINCREGKSH